MGSDHFSIYAVVHWFYQDGIATNVDQYHDVLVALLIFSWELADFVQKNCFAHITYLGVNVTYLLVL